MTLSRKKLKSTSKSQNWRLVHGYETVPRKKRKRKKTIRKRK